MAAALPYLDGLFAFAGPDDLTEMARQLRRQGSGGRVGYEYDTRRDATRPTAWVRGDEAENTEHDT